MPVRDFRTLEYPVGTPVDQASPDDLRTLQSALARLGFSLAADASPSLVASALASFQVARGLPGSREVDETTLEYLNKELAHRYFVDSKTRTARLHALLAELGYTLEPAEVEKRQFGPTTSAAITSFQVSHAWQVVDGSMTPALHDAIEDAALAERFRTGDGFVELHQLLDRAVSIAGVHVNESHTALFRSELAAKECGPGTGAVLQALQTQKFGVFEPSVEGTYVAWRPCTGVQACGKEKPCVRRNAPIAHGNSTPIWPGITCSPWCTTGDFISSGWYSSKSPTKPSNSRQHRRPTSL